MSLDAFLANTTSEDNASFSEIMKVNEEKHKEKHAWLYEQEEEKRNVSIFILNKRESISYGLVHTNVSKISFSTMWILYRKLIILFYKLRKAENCNHNCIIQ